MKKFIKTILIVLMLLLVTMPTSVFAAHPPLNVATLNTISTTDTGATFGLLTANDPDFTRYRVYLNGVFYFDSGSGIPPNAGTSIIISGLSSVTTYTVRVTSLDSSWNESSGRSVTFKTAPTPTPNIGGLLDSKKLTISGMNSYVDNGGTLYSTDNNISTGSNMGLSSSGTSDLWYKFDKPVSIGSYLINSASPNFILLKDANMVTIASLVNLQIDGVKHTLNQTYVNVVYVQLHNGDGSYSQMVNEFNVFSPDKPAPPAVEVALIRGQNLGISKLTIVNYDTPKKVKDSDLLPYSYKTAPNMVK